MANAAYWFKHDSNAKDDYKCMILVDQLGLEGYGIYWILIETLREQSEGRYPLSMLPILAKRYNSSAEKFRAVVTGYGLFETFEDDTFASPALLSRTREYEALCAKRKEIGASGGRKKTENRLPIGNQDPAKHLPIGNQDPAKHLPIGNQDPTEQSRAEQSRVELNRAEQSRYVKGCEVLPSVLLELQKEGFALPIIDAVILEINQSDKVSGKINSIKGLLLSWLKNHKSKPAAPQYVGSIVKPISEQIEERKKLYNIPEDKLITAEQATAMRKEYDRKYGFVD